MTVNINASLNEHDTAL